MKILINDGMHTDAIIKLKTSGFEVDTVTIDQEMLPEFLKTYDAIVVRSATKVRQDLIDTAPNLKVIGRAGVGMDNIDVAYARSKGIKVINTPAASSQSVAELVFAHLFSMARNLYISNRKMPSSGASDFKSLKKAFSKGIELRGKTLGIIGFGRIGQSVARMALGLGMNVMPFKLDHDEVKIGIDFFKIKDAEITITVNVDDYEELLSQSDFITLHVPFPQGAKPVLTSKQFNLMKDGVMVVNTSRGGVIVEDDLLEALDNGKVASAALDVFENEPTPRKEILEHPNISLSPHIGASTIEAQRRIGMEMADKLITILSKAEES